MNKMILFFEFVLLIGVSVIYLTLRKMRLELRDLRFYPKSLKSAQTSSEINPITGENTSNMEPTKQTRIIVENSTLTTTGSSTMPSNTRVATTHPSDQPKITPKSQQQILKHTPLAWSRRPWDWPKLRGRSPPTAHTTEEPFRPVD